MCSSSLIRKVEKRIKHACASTETISQQVIFMITSFIQGVKESEPWRVLVGSITDTPVSHFITILAEIQGKMPKFEWRSDGLMLGLGIALAVSPALAIRWADWVPGLWVLQVISVLAVGAGFALAKSRFSGRLAFLVSLIYGLFVVGFFSGLLLPPELPWHEKIPQLVARQANWLIKAANVILDSNAADTSRDGLIFVMQTGFLLWWLGYTTGWYTFRRLRIWQAVLPTGIVLLITVVNYYGEEPLGAVLVFFLLVAVLYVIASHYLQREEGWIRARVVFSRGAQVDFLQAGFLIALLALPAALFVPHVSAGEELKELTRPVDSTWQRVQDGWTQLFASLKSYGGEYSDPYGGTLALGGPRQIVPQALMDVDASARYWRGTVYDTFTGEGWTSTAETRLVVAPDRPLEMTDYFQRVPITATVVSYLPNSSMLYFPHQPAWTDRQARFTVFDATGLSYDIISVFSRYVIYEGKSYQTAGSFSAANTDHLRLAGSDYPVWVRERYLQLPDDFSPRIADLAASIAAPYATPYDRAEALTDWLRTNIVYNEAVAAPPVDVDPLEYLLFDSKEGYCNYYASALAVMLRSQGIPARVAAGYTRGVWQEELGVFRIYSTNAHAWVEVFFPSFGWVEFEPTTAQPNIVRRASEGEEAGQEEAVESDEDLFDPGPELSEEEELIRKLLEEQENAGSGGGIERPENTGWIIAGSVLLVGLAAAGVVWRIRGQRLDGVSVVAHVYDRMNGFARWLGVHLLPSQTPHERAAVLMAVVPDAVAPIDVITDLYVEERFGQVDAGKFDFQANRAWSELWPQMIKQSLIHVLSRFQRNGDEEKPKL